MSGSIDFDFYRRYQLHSSELPYSSEEEYRNDCFVLISGYLCTAILVKKNSLGFLPGGLFDAEDALAYLGSYPVPAPATPDELVDMTCRFEEQIATRLAATPNARNFRLYQVSDRFALDDFTYFCLLASLCCEFNQGFSSAFAVLQGDQEQRYPTIGLLHSLFGLIHPAPSMSEMLLLNGSSRASLLFNISETRNISLRHVVLRPRVIAYLMHSEYQDDTPWGSGQIIRGSNKEELLFCDEQYHTALSVLTSMRTSDDGRVLAMCGPSGCGKKLTLHKLAHTHGNSFLVLPLGQISITPENISELRLLLTLENIILCFEHPDFEEDTLNVQLAQLLHILKDEHPIIILLAHKMRKSPAFPNYLCRKIEYSFPDQGMAVHLWEHFSKEYKLDKHLDWKAVSGKFTLTPGQIRSVLQDAAIDAKDKPITPEVLRGAILRSGTSRLSELADRIEPFYNWDDLVLAERSKQMLRDVCNRIKYKYKVEEEWGFKSKSAYGNGISILLYGPPGTGKTMSAQVLARELWLPLYRINLAQIISKYIGETAKNLDAIFNEAKNSNVILFFDEADALFSKRTDIQNSNDRYSNSEISYLLQKIEEFNGISILATNLANHFDEAFRRRIQYMINIHMPSEEERLTLWKQAFPAGAPLAPDVDFQLLASCLEFSGSVIKSAVLQAAYFAADENCAVGMAQIVRAVRIELTKLGKPEPHCLQIF